jgi:hypothetical protein
MELETGDEDGDSRAEEDATGRWSGAEEEGGGAGSEAQNGRFFGRRRRRRSKAYRDEVDVRVDYL